MLRRIMSLMLAFVLLMSAVPVPAMATEDPQPELVCDCLLRCTAAPSEEDCAACAADIGNCTGIVMCEHDKDASKCTKCAAKAERKTALEADLAALPSDEDIQTKDTDGLTTLKATIADLKTRLEEFDGEEVTGEDKIAETEASIAAREKAIRKAALEADLGKLADAEAIAAMNSEALTELKTTIAGLEDRLEEFADDEVDGAEKIEAAETAIAAREKAIRKAALEEDLGELADAEAIAAMNSEALTELKAVIEGLEDRLEEFADETVSGSDKIEAAETAIAAREKAIRKAALEDDLADIPAEEDILAMDAEELAALKATLPGLKQRLEEFDEDTVTGAGNITAAEEDIALAEKKLAKAALEAQLEALPSVADMKAMTDAQLDALEAQVAPVRAAYDAFVAKYEGEEVAKKDKLTTVEDFLAHTCTFPEGKCPVCDKYNYQCGPILNWEFDEESGILMIFRDADDNETGAVEYAPWLDFAGDIREIHIAKNVTGICDGAFAGIEAEVCYDKDARIDTSKNYGGDVTWFAIGRPAAPEVTMTDVAAGGFKLTWKGNVLSHSFKIYRYTEDSDAQLIDEVSGTSFTDTEVTAGTEYFYYVVAYNKGGAYSEQSEEVSGLAKLDKPKVQIEIVHSTGKIRLVWDVQDDADGYVVYRATSKTGKYTVVKDTTSNSFTDTSVTAGKTYYYKVMAAVANQNANSPYSDVKSIICKLPQPKVKVSNVSSTGKIKLSWSAVSGAVKYRIERAAEGGEYKLLKETTSLSYTDTSATAGKTYVYRVRANASASAGNSHWSEEAERACDLVPPTITLSNVSSTGKIKISWKEVSKAQRYEVARATSKTGTYKSLGTTYALNFTDSTAEGGKTYYYKVRALAADSAANSAYSSVKSLLCDLKRPQLTMSNVASSGKIKVSWEKVTNAVSYKVYRATSKSGTYSLVKTTTSLSYTDTSASAGKTYYYKVIAVAKNTSANSAYSAVASRTCDLARPTITMSNVASTGKNKVSWKAIKGASKYQIYRAGEDGEFSLLATASSTATSYTDKASFAGITYTYKVRAVSSVSAANSAYSAEKERVCDLAQPSVTVSNVSSTGKLKLTWKKIEKAEEYEIYRATSKTGTYSKVKTTTSLSYTDTTGTSGKTYYFKVRALCDVSDAKSAYSAIKSGTCALDRPVITSVDNSTAGKPVIKWEKLDKAAEYKVYRATSASGTYTLVKTTTATSFTDTSAAAGKVYYYKIKAIGSGSAKDSGYSAIESIACKLSTPSITVSNVASTGKVKITWKAITNAYQYRVLRSDEAEGDYEQIKGGISSKTLTYTDSSAEPGMKYYYKVQALTRDGEGDSEWSAAKSAFCDLKRPTVTLSNDEDTGKVLVKWSSVSGAEKYQITRCATSTGTFTVVGEVPSDAESFMDIHAEPGDTYYYKVRALSDNSNAHSAYSEAKSKICKLAMPDVEAYYMGSRNRLEWNYYDLYREYGIEYDEDYVSNYKIYRATSADGTFTLLDTVSQNYYVDKDVKAGQTYYYRVLAVSRNPSAHAAYAELECGPDAPEED